MSVAAFLVKYVAAMLRKPSFDISMAIAGAVPVAVRTRPSDEVRRAEA
jgi:hypothetical protein